MLDYPTCLKLKEAGFPFDWDDVIRCKGGELCPARKCAGWHNWAFLNEEQKKSYREDFSNQPTLSELIEACRQKEPEFKLAFYSHGVVVERKGKDDIEIQPTPEEAVANLYLALAKSK